MPSKLGFISEKLKFDKPLFNPKPPFKIPNTQSNNNHINH
jgi:hypothetical protein